MTFDLIERIVLLDIGLISPRRAASFHTVGCLIRSLWETCATCKPAHPLPTIRLRRDAEGQLASGTSFGLSAPAPFVLYFFQKLERVLHSSATSALINWNFTAFNTASWAAHTTPPYSYA